METLQFKVIKNITQYNEYCNLLEEIATNKKTTREQKDMIELLTVLIEKWDREHNTFPDVNPIALLAYLLKENQLKATDLAKELEVSKSLISDILNYRRRISRDLIRKLADRFKVSQELFNRPYKLKSPVKKTRKKLTTTV